MSNYEDAKTPYEAYPDELREAHLAYVEALRKLIGYSGVIRTDAAKLRRASELLVEVDALLSEEPKGRPMLRFRRGIPTDDPNSTIPFSPISGRFNPMAPPVEFHVEGKKLIGEVTFNDAYEGPNGCVHGSIVASVYDQMLALANIVSGAGGPTASLEILYQRPTPLYRPLRFEAWLEREEGRKLHTYGRCLVDGEVVTESRGLFIQLDPARSYPQWSNRTRSGDPAE